MNATFGFYGVLNAAEAEAQRLADKYGHPIYVWDVDAITPAFEVKGTPRPYTLATRLASSRCKGRCMAVKIPEKVLESFDS